MCKKSLLMMLLLALLVPWAANAQTRDVATVDFETGNISALSAVGAVTNDATYPWTIVNTKNHTDGGTYCMKSTNNGVNSSSTSIEVSVEFNEAGSISFYCWASCESASNYWDYGIFYIDGTQMDRFLNVTDWVAKTYEVTAGSHTFKWTYTKDSSAAGNDDCFYVDDITFNGFYIPSCPKPTGLAVSNVTDNSATLNWNENGTASSWQLCVNNDEANLITTSTKPYELTGLTAQTAYTVKVRSVAGSEQSDWTDNVSFSTTAVAVAVGDSWSDDFEGASCGWELINGTCTNAWAWGTAASNGGTHGLYVSNDGGTTNAYTDNSTAMVYATKLLNFTEGKFEFAYNWMANGEGSGNYIYDYLRVALVPASVTLTPGTSVPTGFTAFALPTGWIAVDGGSYLNGVTAWQSQSVAVNVPAGNYYMVLAWRNDYSSGTQPPAAVDNVSITRVACPYDVTDLAVDTITPRGATLSWNGGGATQWQVVYADNADFTNATQEIVSATTYDVTGLDEATKYYAKVRSYCGGEDFGSWCNAVSFTTDVACHAPTNLAFADITAYSANVSWDGEADSFEMEYATGGSSYLTYDFEDGTLQGWTNLLVNTDGGEWLHSNDQPYGHDYTALAHGGTGFALCYSFIDYTGSFNTNAYLVSPTSYSIADNASLNFWYDMANDEYPEYFEVCVATVANPTASDFTPIWTLPTAKGNNGLREAMEVRQRNTRYEYWREVTLDLNAYAGQSIWIAFHDVNNDMYEVWIDDITIDTGHEIVWTPVGTVTSPYLFNNLDPETTYMVRVRANCGSDGYSAWLEGSFTTLPACWKPTNLVVSNIDKRSADLAWTSNGEETAWQICVNGDETNLILVSDTSYSFTNLTPETLYNVKVRAYCDEQLQSAWSSPVTFTTLVACPAPTNLVVDSITTTSAVASWTGEGDFELQYGEDVWKYYDNGVYATTMGAGGTIYWGMMLPAESLTAGEPLTNVALHTSYAGEATLNVYLGGDQPTGTPAATQTFTMADDGDFMEITLDTPVAIDGTQNLWITFYQSGLTYAADGCTGPTDPNGRWVSLDGETWADIAGYGYNYTWMIRAAFGNNTQTEWVTIDNATSPQAITGLTPETDYLVRVKHVCGGIDGESVWATRSFVTLSECLAPWDVAVADSTITATSAILAWEGYKDSYDVRYFTMNSIPFFTENFANGIPSSWTNTATADTLVWTVVDGHAQSGNTGVNSSESSLSFTATLTAAGFIEFDAECRGEGSSTYYDHCDFYIDSERVLYHGADLTDAGWLHYSFNVTAGTHTFKWSYTKDSSVSKPGDYFAIDNIVLSTLEVSGLTTIEEVTSPYTLTGLTPNTEYYVQVSGNGCDNWSETEDFTTLPQTTITQTIALVAGVNWVSFYVETDLDALKAALVEALPGTTMKIKSKSASTTYNGSRWRGSLNTLDLALMYKVEVPDACEIVLEGMPIDPAAHPITITSGLNWIGFPFQSEMTIANAFAGFAISGDKVKDKSGSTTYNGTRWRGNISNLAPGKGYIYESSSNESRPFTYPSPAKK